MKKRTENSARSSSQKESLSRTPHILVNNCRILHLFILYLVYVSKTECCTLLSANKEYASMEFFPLHAGIYTFLNNLFGLLWNFIFMSVYMIHRTKTILNILFIDLPIFPWFFDLGIF